MEWISTNMYEKKLTTHPDAAFQTLSDLPHITQNRMTTQPLKIIDTGWGDTECRVGKSIVNQMEANIVLQQISKLIESKVKQKDITLITPYQGEAQQIQKLVNNIYNEVEIKTIDAFQGGENEAIIISMVRANNKRNIGFINDSRRLNVALSRSKRHLTIIGNIPTLRTNPLLKNLIEYTEKVGTIERAQYRKQELPLK